VSDCKKCMHTYLPVNHFCHADEVDPRPEVKFTVYPDGRCTRYARRFPPLTNADLMGDSLTVGYPAI
jgi:hypothetical protein